MKKEERRKNQLKWIKISIKTKINKNEFKFTEMKIKISDLLKSKFNKCCIDRQRNTSVSRPNCYCTTRWITRSTCLLNSIITYRIRFDPHLLSSWLSVWELEASTFLNLIFYLHIETKANFIL